MKSAMAQQWTQVADKVEALSQRERWMVLLAGLVVIYALMNALLVGPVSDKKTAMLGEIAQSQSQVATLSQELNALAQRPVVNPDAENLKRANMLKNNILALSTEIQALSERLIHPQDMPDLLKGLLKKNTNIKLVAMQTVAAEDMIKPADTGARPVGTQPEQATNPPQSSIYRHGVQMTIAGPYLDLLRYVEALSQLPVKVLVGKAELQAKAHPESELTMTVYTLSLDSTWLSI